MNQFFQQYGLFLILGLLLVFMIFSTRRRNQKLKAEQEQKQRNTVPGARVLLQGGIYGTIVDIDPDDLDAPARVEIAPGVVMEVHSQAVLRVVDSPADALDSPFDEQPLDDRVHEIDNGDEAAASEALPDRDDTPEDKKDDN
ncbi:preprotein translocase subunit YajC [Microbacterium sp. YY-01]|uniref:preprotein translocase subunit YajC n=1 Tax=Microbacterium sp. YY-01 TaxID=3421634 RepID=UPI003D178B1D